MARVFISYRRIDSQGEAGRLHDSLEKLLGAGTVFRDVVDIAGGADFERALQHALARCDAVLVLMGERWLPELQQRLAGPEVDYVRIEVAESLKSGRRVLPLLLRGQKMPAASSLPEDLQPLCKRNAMSLRDDIWDTDVGLIANALGRPYNRRLLLLRALAALVLVPIVAYLLMDGQSAQSARTAVLGAFAAYAASELGGWAWYRRRLRRRQA